MTQTTEDKINHPSVTVYDNHHVLQTKKNFLVNSLGMTLLIELTAKQFGLSAEFVCNHILNQILDTVHSWADEKIDEYIESMIAALMARQSGSVFVHGEEVEIEIVIPDEETIPVAKLDYVAMSSTAGIAIDQLSRSLNQPFDLVAKSITKESSNRVRRLTSEQIEKVIMDYFINKDNPNRDSFYVTRLDITKSA